MKALFDTGHGQRNWEQTGFLARTINRSFSGVADILSEMGVRCFSGNLSTESLEDVDLLIIPPPAGQFNRQTSEWEPLQSSLFTESDIEKILGFVNGGGRLLAFSYRFGDSFAKTNLREVFLPMGCFLQDTAAIHLDSFVNDMHPLAVPFETTREHLPILKDEQHFPDSVQLRAMATLSNLPGMRVFPITTTPPRCIVFEPHSFKISHKPQSLGSGGYYSNGRFAIFGGPHAFETGGYGLLNSGSNRLFARMILEWIVSNEPGSEMTHRAPEKSDSLELNLKPFQLLWKRVEDCQSPKTKGAILVQFVDKIFQGTGIMTPIGKGIWNLKRTSELDLVYQSLSKEPIWSDSKGIIPVECKNWDKPVGASEIAWFAEKVSKTGSQIGFFAARSFTRQAWMTVEQVLMKNRVTVGLLNDDDYRSLMDGNVSPRDLIESSLLRSMLL